MVPTMGALHAGHVSLIQRAHALGARVVVSIFVNPLQFNENSDFEKYPRTVEHDLVLAEQHGVSCVFLPSTQTMYSPNASVRVAPGTAAEGMEGNMRPGHFEGVTTVVAKLFNCVLPDRAYFGKKDYQQLAVIRQMVIDLDFPVELHGVDTVREHDGLAMSSRNTRLGRVDRLAASVLYRALTAGAAAHRTGVLEAAAIKGIVDNIVGEVEHARLEYVSVVDPLTLRPVTTTRNGAVVCIAVWFGDVRLIDNIELPHALTTN